MDMEQYLKFSIKTYGNFTKVSDTISKGRCRIFYKYSNRNGTYITDEFAEKLLATLPYAPVKGIYDEQDKDYTDHGTARSQGRIYGIVPAEPNVQWESHLDEDGVERTYACCDVYLYTALYAEAAEILTKGQSMELYDKSIKGHLEVIDGRKQFVFEEGCFLGLQALGEDVEPCFEGAAFFTLYQELKTFLQKMEEFQLNKNKGGDLDMHETIYKLSDRAKEEALWALLNSHYNEEDGWVMNYGIMEVYDNYCVARNYAEGIYERIYYTKEEDNVTITSKEKCYIMDVSEVEKNVIEHIQTLNGGTYEKADEVYESVATLTEEKDAAVQAKTDLEATYATEKSEFEQKITECETEICTLKTERDEVVAKFNQQTETLNEMTEKLEGLKQYKLDVETEQKQQLLAQYSSKLSADVLEGYKEKFSEYTVEGLDRELAYVLVKSTPTVFNQDSGAGYVPKETHKTGIEAILENYKR